jgi:minor extracellular serine protease Vpr
VIAGTADVYQWGLRDDDDVNEATVGGSGYDLRAVGVQSFDVGEGEQLLVFAVNTHDRWSTAATNEYDILVDTGGSRAPEYAVVGVDFGAVTAGSFNGVMGSFVFDLVNGGATIEFLALAPTDSSTLLLPVLASQLGLTADDGDFTYSATSFSLEGAGMDPMPRTAGYNPWDPALLGGFPFSVVPPGGSAEFDLALDATSYAKQKPMGVMIVSLDNASGPAEAQLIHAPPRRPGD